jgi:hypothetical protein
MKIVKFFKFFLVFKSNFYFVECISIAGIQFSCAAIFYVHAVGLKKVARIKKNSFA